MAGRQVRFPCLDKRVEVYNVVREEWMSGTCVAHLSTQWVIHLDDHNTEIVIHSNWEWRYT